VPQKHPKYAGFSPWGTPSCENLAMRSRALLTLSLLTTLPLHADDGAASIAAGGIIVMKREPRITMAKEVLQISPSKIVVDYDFRNNSDQDITTKVAFPVPPYTWEGMIDAYFVDASFDDFKLSIDGQPVAFATEMRAYVAGHEITSLLKAEHIDIASFGHTSTKEGYDSPSADFDHANAHSRARLLAAGAFKDGSPNWRIVKKYYWTQAFPAHKLVHIEHQYTPVLGGSNTIGDPTVYQGKDAVPEYAESCPDPSLRTTLSKIWNKPRGDFDGSPLWINYVNFILTTANTWKTPIEDFTLIVERPTDPKHKTWVSFCWDGPVTQIDPDHFSAHISGLVPKKELQIGFISANVK
jgi:hypothetical protein